MMFITKMIGKVTIEPIVLLYVFAIFAEYGVIEDLFYVSKCFVHFNLTSNADIHICVENKTAHKGRVHGSASSNDDDPWKVISAETNNAQLIYNGILYACSIVASFVAAAYSDRRAKLSPVLIPVIGSAVTQIFVLLFLSLSTGDGNSGSFLFTHNWLLFVCCFISGITGGTSTLLSTCFAFIAERCTPSMRTTRITIVEACLFGGGFFGFTYAGAIMRRHINSLLRYQLNFGVFLIIHLLLAVFILLRRGMFKKSSSSQSSSGGGSTGESKCTTCCNLFTSVLKTIFRKRIHPRQRQLVLLILFAFTLIAFWNVTITTLLFIYTRNQPLHWPTWQYSYFNSAKFGICGVFLCLLPVTQYLLTNRFHMTPFGDYSIILIGLLSRGLAAIFIGLATNDTLMIVALVAISLAEYPIPAIRSLVSKIIESNEKAQMFVFMATIQSVCSFIGGIALPALYNVIFNGPLADNDEMLGPFNGPGMIFVVIGLFQFFSIGIFIYVNRIMKQYSFGLTQPPPSPSLSPQQQLSVSTGDD